MKDIVFRTEKIGENWYLESDGDILETPGGCPVGSHSREIACRAKEDCDDYGADPTDFPSIYGLLCSYLDFSSEENRDELIAAILSDLEDDTIYQELAFRTSMEPDEHPSSLADPAWPVDYLNKTGFFEAWTVNQEGPHMRVIDLGKIQAVIEPILKALSPRQLMTLVYVSANWKAAICLLALMEKRYSTAEFVQVISEAGVPTCPGRKYEALIGDFLQFASLPEDRASVADGDSF